MVAAACERVSLLFAWSVDGLAIVRSARTLVYHRVTIVVVVLVVVRLGVGRVDAIVVVVQDGQEKGRINKRRRRKKRTMNGVEHQIMIVMACPKPEVGCGWF